MDSSINKFMIFATLILSLVIILMLSNSKYFFQKNMRDNDIAIDTHPVVFKTEDNSTLGKSEILSDEATQNSMSSSNILQNISDILNIRDVNAPPTTTFVPYALATPAPSSSNSISLNSQTSTTGIYAPSSSKTSLTSYANVTSNDTTIPSGLSTNTSSYRHLGSITITGDVAAGQNIITVSDSNITLTKGMGLEINGKIYIIKETSSYFNFFTLSYNNSVTLSENLESAISVDSNINVFSILESDNNASPGSFNTSSIPNYPFSSINNNGESFSSNVIVESFIEGAANPTPTQTPTSTLTQTPTSTLTQTPTSTLKQTPTTTTANASTNIPSIVSTSTPTSTPSSIATDYVDPIVAFINGINTTALTISTTPNKSTTPKISTTSKPLQILANPLKMYILHLSKETTINSKLYFTPYEYITDKDLERISNEINTTPETFSQKEGLTSGQNVPGLPDFNSCANNTTTTKPPNSSVDNSSTSMLYITDCVAYYIYSAVYKNKTLVIQLDTSDNRKINAGYYRLSI